MNQTTAQDPTSNLLHSLRPAEPPQRLFCLVNLSAWLHVYLSAHVGQWVELVNREMVSVLILSCVLSTQKHHKTTSLQNTNVLKCYFTNVFAHVFIQFQLQMFDIICSTSWASRDKCCELPALVRNEHMHILTCTHTHPLKYIAFQLSLNITAWGSWSDNCSYDQIGGDGETRMIKVELKPCNLQNEQLSGKEMPLIMALVVR